ncbi:MAG: RDD family protein [Oscillospiraceae bacterium]|nr:RDD family protein [Oscillospiraceae bacterium]
MQDERDLFQNTEGQYAPEVQASVAETFPQETQEPVVIPGWDGSQKSMEENAQKVWSNSPAQQFQSVPTPGNGQGFAYYDTSAPQEIIAQIPKEYKTPAEQLYEAHNWLPGGFWVRYFARMLDNTIETVVLVCGFFAATNLFGTYASRAFLFDLPLGLCLGYLFVLIYETLMVKWAGGTLGKIALRLKVVDLETGEPLSWWQSFFRASFGRFLSDLSIVGVLLVFGKDHRTLNDRLTDSCVVYR